MKRFLLIKTTDNIGMGGANCAELHCTLLKDGSLSLRECINQYSDGGRYYLKSIRGIKKPNQFLGALNEMNAVMNQFTIEEVLDELFKTLPSFAALTAVYARIADNEDDVSLFDKIHKTLVRMKIEMPKDFTKAVSLYDAIYFFVKSWCNNHQNTPVGTHNVMNRVVIFPSE